MKLSGKSWSIRWAPIPTPLGTLVDAGFVRNSRGTGFGRFRRHGSFALVLSLGGRARYRDEEGNEAEVLPGDCIWVTPDISHQYGPEAGSRWDEIFLDFGGPPFAEWVGRARKFQFPIQRLNDCDLWFSRWLAIAQMRPRTFSDSVGVLARIHLLMNDLMNLDATPKPPGERLEASRLHVEAWPASEVPRWEQIALESGQSYDAWRKGFREKFGISPARYRRQVMMQAAARLVARSNLTNDQLAEHFGSTDGFHFSKLFKTEHGLSPRDYRHRLNESGAIGRRRKE